MGSVREVTDSTGTVHARYDYDPYGRVTKVSGDVSADFLYTGHYYHALSNLYLAKYRAYDSNIGRWLSRDPIAEEGGVNLYGYCAGNPINLIDLFGMDTCRLVMRREVNFYDTTWSQEVYLGHWKLLTGSLSFIDYVEFDLYLVILVEGKRWTVIDTYECTNSCNETYKKTLIYDGYEGRPIDSHFERRNIKYADGGDGPVRRKFNK